MRILVTGGDGFLGSAALRALAARGHDCAALSRRPVKREDGAELILGDLFAPESYRDGVRRFAPDALLHCAWSGAYGGAADDPAQHHNVAASAHLATIALEAGATTLLGVGSQAEYGAKAGALRETDGAEPTTPYGAAKRAAGEALLALCAANRARGIWARVFALYGPGDDERRFLAMVLSQLRLGRAPALTPCEQRGDFLHVRDAADALVALLECETAEGVYNIGSGEAPRLADVVLSLRDRIAPQVEPAFGALPYRADQRMRLQADISRICAATGWRPRIALEDGLAELAASARIKSDAA
jgi:UDP-glucose 4-epimerase